jgi:hypothetical protein
VLGASSDVDFVHRMHDLLAQLPLLALTLLVVEQRRCGQPHATMTTLLVFAACQLLPA